MEFGFFVPSNHHQIVNGVIVGVVCCFLCKYYCYCWLTCKIEDCLKRQTFPIPKFLFMSLVRRVPWTTCNSPAGILMYRKVLNFKFYIYIFLFIIFFRLLSVFAFILVLLSHSHFIRLFFTLWREPIQFYCTPVSCLFFYFFIHCYRKFIFCTVLCVDAHFIFVVC